MFYIMEGEKLSIFDNDKDKVEQTRAYMPQLEGQYTIETDIVTAEELREYPYKVLVDDIEIEVDVPDYDEDGNPVMIEVPIYDEEGNQIGTELVPSTHKEKIIVKGLVLNPDFEKEKEEKERERLDALILTPSDVERALLKAKGWDFDDLKVFLKENGFTDLQIKAIGIELRANNFYRGALLGDIRIVDTIGQILGYDSAAMDYLFENKELPEVKPTPEPTAEPEEE